MLIANIFLNILSKFYCLHKLLRIKSARNTVGGVLARWTSSFFSFALSPAAARKILIYDFITASFKLFLSFRFAFRRKLWVRFHSPALQFSPVWQALKIFFYDFPLHNSACSVCINFHTGKFLSDLSNTTGNRTRHSRSLLAFHNIFNRTNILDSAFFLLFYFLRRSLSQTFSWLMKNNLNE